MILEGIPSVVAGVVALAYLTDWPRDAQWLPKDERDWLATELEREQAAKKTGARVNPWRALRDPKVIALAVVVLLLHHQQHRSLGLAAEDRPADFWTADVSSDADFGHPVADGHPRHAAFGMALRQDG